MVVTNTIATSTVTNSHITLGSVTIIGPHQVYLLPDTSRNLRFLIYDSMKDVIQFGKMYQWIFGVLLK